LILVIHAHYHTKRAFIYLNFFEEEKKKPTNQHLEVQELFHFLLSTTP